MGAALGVLVGTLLGNCVGPCKSSMEAISPMIGFQVEMVEFIMIITTTYVC